MAHTDPMLLQNKSNTLPVELFEADLQSVCGLFDIRPKAEQETIWGKIKAAVNADIEMAMVATNLQQIIRTSQHIRRDQGENYFLIMQQDGRALMAQNETATMLMPGDIILIDSAKPSEFTFFGDCSTQVSLHLPRTEVEERFGTEIQGGLSMSHDDPTAKAIQAVITKAVHSEQASPQSSYLRDALFGLLGAFLFDQKQGLTDHRADFINDGAPLLMRSLDIVEASFRDSEFAVKNIADILCVHPRQVQRAFENLGVTPTKFLLAKRLEFARSRLEARLLGQHNELISDIAYEAGFSDLSYFNRRFRQVFGCAPGEYGEGN